MNLRIGFGYDIHRLIKERELFLGGIKIPSRLGLEGHSDADVVLHAICDAILGALSMGDIGEHFPDTDDNLKNIRSTIILEKVKKMASFKVQNLDITIVTETPMLSPYKQRIRESIADILGVDKEIVSVKAKRNEGVGLIGEKKAIACFVIVLLVLQ